MADPSLSRGTTWRGSNPRGTCWRSSRAAAPTASRSKTQRTFIYANDAAGRCVASDRQGDAAGSHRAHRRTVPDARQGRTPSRSSASRAAGRWPGRPSRRPSSGSVSSDGCRTMALVRATPLFDGHGGVRHVVNVFVDITDDQKRRHGTTVPDGRFACALALLVGMGGHAPERCAARGADDGGLCAVDVLGPDGSLSLIAIATSTRRRSDGT